MAKQQITQRKQDEKVVSVITTDEAKIHEPTFKIRKTVSPKIMADDFVSRFGGISPINITELIDENGKIVASDEQLKAIGCTFATIHVERDGVDFMCKKHRETKENNPYIDTAKGKATKKATERYTIQVLLNCIWQNVIDNRREKHDGTDTGHKVQEHKVNGIIPYKDSRVVHTNTDNSKFYINYIQHRFLTDRVVTDESGAVIPTEILEAYAKQTKEQKQANREREAVKHGITIEFDPQYRTIKVLNIEIIKVLNMVYKPTE
jgi:hypothetical protein